MKPRIGIMSRYLAKDNRFVTKAGYIYAISAVGGLPIQIPIADVADVDAIAGMMDGIIIKIPPHSGGYFGFGHSPNNTSGAQVRIKRLPACAHYLLPVNGSRGSNILNWSASLSLFSWSAMYSVIAFVFFPTVST